VKAMLLYMLAICRILTVKVNLLGLKLGFEGCHKTHQKPNAN